MSKEVKKCSRAKKGVKPVENEEKKKFLLSYQQSKRAIKRMEKVLQEIETIEIDNKMTQQEQGNMQQSTKQKIKEKTLEQVQNCEKVIQQIENMEDEKEKDALIYKYIIGLTEDAAAKEMGYTKRQFQRIVKKAIERFEICR